MRKLLLTTAAAALVFSIPALAIDVGVHAGGSVSANAGGAGVDAGTGANVSTNVGSGGSAGTGTNVRTNFNSGVNTGTGSNVSTNFNTGDDTQATANISTAADATAAVSAISHSQAGINQIRSLKEVTSVEIVDVDTLAQSNADTALEKALTKNAQGAAKLQAALQSQADVMAAIMAEDPDFDVTSVVAADVKADGRLVIFTRG